MANGDLMLPAFPKNDELKATAQLFVDVARGELVRREQTSQRTWDIIQPFESVPLPCINPQILPPSYQAFADAVIVSIMSKPLPL